MFDNLRAFWPKKWPSKKQWKRLPEILSIREKIIFFSLLVVTFFSFFYTLFALYSEGTAVAPSQGGVYREGFVQTTRWLTINPLYATQSEVERDIIEVAFDGLMQYDREGNISPNLAEKYISEDGMTYDVILRDDIYWSDGEKITADDVVFTVQTILNPEYQSTLRSQWAGVEVEKRSEKEVRFTLDSPSAIFPDNLTLKIIPKHIFKDKSPRDFRYSIYNMKPVGSGPYRFKEIKETSSGDIEFLKMERNPHYFRSTPYLNEVSFHFFRDTDEMLRAQRRGEIDGFLIAESARTNFPFDEIRGFNHYEFIAPRYFSALFNLRSEGAIGDVAVRKALTYATNKNEIFYKVLQERGIMVESPLALDLYNGNYETEEKTSFDLEKAKEILKEEGFENGKRKAEEVFTFTKDTKEGSQGEDVRNLQRCFLYLQEEDENIYPDGEITGFFNESTKEAVIYFQEKYREDILDPHNFRSGTGMVAGSTRKKLNKLCEELFEDTVHLEVSITTINDPTLLKTAQILKEQWSKVGIKTNIITVDTSNLRESVIRSREFDILLFGTMLTRTPNPLVLWHSSKVDEPGLNLSGFENDDADDLLEKIIAETDKEERREMLYEVEEIIQSEYPGVFLYNPGITYSVSEKINGINEGFLVNSSQRFDNIDNWYIYSRRTIR